LHVADVFLPNNGVRMNRNYNLNKTATITSHKFCRKYRSENRANRGPWVYQRWDQVPRRSKHPYKQGPLGFTRCGIRCLGGVSIHTNRGLWVYQRWDQVSGRNKYPYKQGPLGLPEVGSGV
jgi:hypothetical protein